MNVRLGYTFAQAVAAADDPWYVAIAYGRFLASLPNGSAHDATTTARELRGKLAEAEMCDRLWAERVS